MTAETHIGRSWAASGEIGPREQAKSRYREKILQLLVNAKSLSPIKQVARNTTANEFMPRCRGLSFSEQKICKNMAS